MSPIGSRIVKQPWPVSSTDTLPESTILRVQTWPGPDGRVTIEWWDSLGVPGQASVSLADVETYSVAL